MSGKKLTIFSKNKLKIIWPIQNNFVPLHQVKQTIKEIGDKDMNRITMQVMLTFTADVDSDLSADDIMERVNLSAVGDGEFVEVHDTEVENFNILNSK